MGMPRWERKQQEQRYRFWPNRNLRPRSRGFTSRKLFRWLLISLAFVAILPPLFFHFKLRRFHQMQLRKCSWMSNPPLVCAHGGDSSKFFANTWLVHIGSLMHEAPINNGSTDSKMQAAFVFFEKNVVAAYQIALRSRVDCIEIDVSRSSDGVLFALHDRDLQWISGNKTSRVGYFSMKEIKELEANGQLPLEFHGHHISTTEDALKMISSSVRQVILDAKVGPPSYEKGLASDIHSVVEKTECKNCLVWAKSDNLVRDVMKVSSDMNVGYIVMEDPSTGARSGLLRMRSAGVVGVYHPLIDEKIVKILHGRNKKVYAWTVDDEVSMQRMLFEQVDAIVTSNPTSLQRLMQDLKAKCLAEGFSS